MLSLACPSPPFSALLLQSHFLPFMSCNLIRCQCNTKYLQGGWSYSRFLIVVHVFGRSHIEGFFPPWRFHLKSHVPRSISFRPVMLTFEHGWNQVNFITDLIFWIQSWSNVVACLLPSTCRSEDGVVIPRFMTTLTFTLPKQPQLCKKITHSATVLQCRIYIPLGLWCQGHPFVPQ